MVEVQVGYRGAYLVVVVEVYGRTGGDRYIDGKIKRHTSES
jgi:hypothetical protein